MRRKDAVGRGTDLGRVDEPSRPHSFLDGDEAVLDAGTQGEVTMLVPQVAHGREDDDEAPGVMGEIGTEAARLGDGLHDVVGARLLEHGFNVAVVVKPSGEHVVEAGADQGRLSSLMRPRSATRAMLPTPKRDFRSSITCGSVETRVLPGKT